MSDAAPVAGKPPGKYSVCQLKDITYTPQCFGRPVVVIEGENGMCVKDAERDGLAGAGADLLQCVNYLHSLGFVTLSELEQVP